MKYCKKCKHVFEDTSERCPVCEKHLSPLRDENTPVYLISASGFELQRIVAALEDGGVPCDKSLKPDDLETDVITGFNNVERDVLVSYSDFNKAYDILVGIGAIRTDGDEIEIIEEYHENDFEEMKPSKRTAVKIISAILFIIIVALVVFGTDYITGLVKGFFS